MKNEFYLNPKYSLIEDFINQIPEDFNHLGYEIQGGRNELRLVSIHGISLVIKYFRKISFFNRIVYATIRKSKARRAFEHTKLLKKYGVTTPEPIAWINCYRNGILYRSYYVSLYTYYKPFEELLKLPVAESEKALKAFARFTYKLHRIGVLHDDFTVKNVLFDVFDDEYDYSLIDINRMRFCSYSIEKGIRNLERLKIPADKMGIIAAEYARLAQINELRMLNAMTFYRIQYLMKISIRKWFKSLLKIISGKQNESHVLKQFKEKTEISLNQKSSLMH